MCVRDADWKEIEIHLRKIGKLIKSIGKIRHSVFLNYDILAEFQIYRDLPH